MDKRDLVTLETKPLVDIVNADGTTTRDRPQTKYFHDVRGFQIGVTDANQHSEGVVLDEVGQW